MHRHGDGDDGHRAERHDHDHEDGHEHAHGSGVLGWLRHTFAHSHDAHEQVDATLATNERGIWALKLSLVGLGATAVLQVVVVWFSGSTALLADTIHNFGDAATSLPLWLAFALQRRERTRRFPYGYGRVKALAGVLLAALFSFSSGLAGYDLYRKPTNPPP